MTTNSCLYFIAIIPPAQLLEEITAIKHEIAAKYLSSKALRIIPHITLKAPFRYPENEEGQLLTWFNGLQFSVHSFDIDLDGYGAFKRTKSPVLFIKPVLSRQLEVLQEELLAQLKDSSSPITTSENEYSFHPHITLAYRDLSFQMFKKAYDHLQQQPFKRRFKASGLTMMKHTDHVWRLLKEKLL